MKYNKMQIEGEEMTEFELLSIASSSDDKTTYGIPRHMALATGDMNVAWLMSRIIFWQKRNIKKHGHNWVIRPHKEWYEEYGMTRRMFDGALEELKKYGLEKDVRKSKYYEWKAVLHLRFDAKVLYEALKTHQEIVLANAVNVQNVQSETTELYNAYISEDTTEDTKTLSPEKDLRTNTRSKPQQPTLSNQVVSSLGADFNDKGADDILWLDNTCARYWNSPLSSGQIKLLSKPVKASIGIYSGLYWSPVELSNHPTLGKFFRQWIDEKKNPSDPTIKAVGKKRWVEQHLCNYTSPEGFLRWMQDVHGRTIEPKEPITVMAQPKSSAPKRLSTIEEMEMFCYDRPMPIDSFLISSEFREFYEANIGNVKNDEEFKRLWMKK